MHPVYLIFQTIIFNRAETEMKCNNGIRKSYTIVTLSYTDSWCLVHFKINISRDHAQKVSHCLAPY
jgi:hypothetical protein